MFKGRRFQDNANQRIVTVLEENGSWVTLDDTRNIKTSVFTQKFSEYLEPENFFTNDSVMENLANQFSQQINLNTVPIVDQHGSTINFTNPNPNVVNPNVAPAGYFVDDREMTSEEKKRELLERFQNNYVPPSGMDEAIDMNMIGRENVYQPPMSPRQRGTYIPPEESETVIKDANTGQILVEPQRVQYTESPRPQPQQSQGDDIYKIYQNNQDQYQTQTRPPEQRPVDRPIEEQPRQEQPRQEPRPVGSAPEYPNYPTPVLSPEEEESFVFFRRFKKVHPITIDVSFNEKIAEPNYVRQTALNFEGDIIKFYTKELMKKIWANPSILEEQIYEKLRFIIMGEEEKSSLSEAIEETTKIISDEKVKTHLENIKEKWEGDIPFSEYTDPEPENPINYTDYIAEVMETPKSMTPTDVDELTTSQIHEHKNKRDTSNTKFTIEDAKNVEKVIENILFETKVDILIPTDLTNEVETLIPTEVSKEMSDFISNEENKSTKNEE
jgi:hypothetical protein